MHWCLVSMFITIKSTHGSWIPGVSNNKFWTDNKIFVSFWVRQCKHKNQDKKSMCLIYNDTFSHKMHLRRLNLFASSTLSRLGLKCVNKNGFYKRSNSWLSLLTTCFFLFVLNRFSIFVFFKSPIYINQIISQRLRLQKTFFT